MSTDESINVDSSAVRQCEEYLSSMANSLSRPHLALEALCIYRAAGLEVPSWALEEIDEAYSSFRDGAPSSGWTREEKTTLAPRSLGDAFGIANIKGEHLSTRRLRAMMAPVLEHLFSEKYSRSETGYLAAAEALGLSPKQVKDWLAKK